MVLDDADVYAAARALVESRFPHQALYGCGADRGRRVIAAGGGRAWRDDAVADIEPGASDELSTGGRRPSEDRGKLDQ